MFKTFLEFTQQLLTLARDVAVAKEHVSDLEEEVRALTLTVQSLKHDLEASKREAALERDKLMLQLENAFLKMSRDLPSAEEPTKVEHKRRQ